MSNYKQIADDLSNWISMQVKTAGLQGVVFGLSGGIDSAVVAGLAVRTMGDKALGVIMPCHSNPEDRAHALLCAKVFGLTVVEVDLTGTYDTLLETLHESAPETMPDRMSRVNLKPRLRMATLYYFANVHSYLVLGTGNRSELAVGYFTKHGDGGVDAMPIAGLVKAEVRALAAELGVPQEIINKPPSAGLWEDQTDEGEMGLTYEQLDNYIVDGVALPQVKRRIEQLASASAHKRRLPVTPQA